MRDAKPSRRSPADASTSASYSPASSLRRRVSTLPRMGEKRALGRTVASCAIRRTLPVPIAGASPSAATAAWRSGWRCARCEHDRVARIFARQRRRHGQALGQHRRHVLRAVDREIDLAAEQRVLDFLDEEPLAAGLRERRVLEPVAGCLDRHQLRRRAPRSSMSRATARACQSASWLPRVPIRSRVTKPSRFPVPATRSSRQWRARRAGGARRHRR